MCINMESFFVCEHSDTLVKRENAIIASVLSMRIFGLVCAFIIESCLSLFDISFFRKWIWVLIKDKQTFMLGRLMSQAVGLIQGIILIQTMSKISYFIQISN